MKLSLLITMTEIDWSELDKKQEGEIFFYSYDPKKFSNKGKALKKNMPVFYNPVQEINRSISLLVFKQFSEQLHKLKLEEHKKEEHKGENYKEEQKEREKSTFDAVIICDVMAASGIRTMRLKQFLSDNVHFFVNDLNPLALNVIKANAKLNSIEIDNKITLFNQDANYLFNQLRNTRSRPDIIDIDPFGSPNIFIENAVNCINEGGLLALTATDTAVFFGVRKQACRKKYNTKPLHSTFLKEVGLRILLYFVATRAHLFNKGIIPMMSLSFDHYIRIFIQLKSGRIQVNENLQQIGYVLWCPECDWRTTIPNDLRKFTAICPHCGGKVDYGGPLWIGNLHNQEFVNKTEEIASRSPKSTIPSKKRILKVLKFAKNEDNFPIGYYEIHKLCDKLNLPTTSREKIIQEIEKNGYQAQQTHINPRALKSDIPIELLVKILQKLNFN